MYDKKKKPIEFVYSYYRGDIYKYVIRMKMAKKGKEGFWIPQDQTLSN